MVHDQLKIEKIHMKVGTVPYLLVPTQFTLQLTICTYLQSSYITEQKITTKIR